MNEIWQILLAVGLPTAIVGGLVGVFFRRLEKKIERDQEARRKYEVFQVNMITAVTALSKANAIALKNGKCNGETSAALCYLDQVKREQRQFLTEQGINHLF